MKINTKVGDLEYQMINGRWVKLRHKKPHKKSSYEMLKQKSKKIDAGHRAIIKKRGPI